MESKVISDIHINKQHNLQISPWFASEDKQRFLIIAGDIGPLNHWSDVKSVLIEMAKRVKQVVLILGNHESAYSDFFKAPQMMQQLIDSTGLSNITLLHRSSLIHDNIALIGATLWSDLDNHQEVLLAEHQRKFDAFFEHTYPNISPKERFEIMAEKYHRQKNWIFSEIARHKKNNKKIIVITHHAPSLQSINPKFKNDDKQHFYASELDDEISQSQPNIWIHGHTHFHNDYTIGKTRVIANTLGLASEATNFNPFFHFKL